MNERQAETLVGLVQLIFYALCAIAGTLLSIAIKVA